MRVNVNVVARAAQMVSDDPAQYRIEVGEQAPSLRCAPDSAGAIVGQYAGYGVEIPERRVGGVVFGNIAGIGEAVGQEAVLHVIGEDAQDGFGLLNAPGGQSEARQRDHRVAAPVGEPGVSGQDGAGCTDSYAGCAIVSVASRGPASDETLVRSEAKCCGYGISRRR